MTGILEELRATIGLKMCEGVGDITAYKLISFCGSAEAVYKEKKQPLLRIPGISSKIFELLHGSIDWGLVEKEIRFVEKNNINYVTIKDREYPKNLLSIDNPPILLFFTGGIEKLNSNPCISIVGTRLATGYGLDAVLEILTALKSTGACIISGLACGIDIAAHKGAMNYLMPTFGVVAHGLKTIYPSIHKIYAQRMTENGGGVLTEFFSEEIPNRENFPKRNRIIAGLSSATIVVEAAKRGGALITAEIALCYKRKLFALPGRYNDKFSEGCNVLIKSKKAKPITSINSLIEELGFKKQTREEKNPLKENLTNEELSLVKLLIENSKISLDNISSKSQLNISNCATILFALEMRGLIRSLPGKNYELC